VTVTVTVTVSVTDTNGQQTLQCAMWQGDMQSVCKKAGLWQDVENVVWGMQKLVLSGLGHHYARPKTQRKICDCQNWMQKCEKQKMKKANWKQYVCVCVCMGEKQNEERAVGNWQNSRGKRGNTKAHYLKFGRRSKCQTFCPGAENLHAKPWLKENSLVRDHAHRSSTPPHHTPPSPCPE